jgi:hypothetical protein
MKKFAFVIMAIALLCAAAPDYPEPVFDRPNSRVIDTYSVRGNADDYVKLHNNTRDTGITFRVYVHNRQSNRWLVFGTGVLKGPGDIDTINSAVSLRGIRYLAIESLNDKDYEVDFYKRRDDIHINIFDI